MKAVFADTFYFLALLNQRDAAHNRAVAASRAAGLTLVTTEFVLIELADALCKPQYRQEVLALCEVVETDPAFRVVRATSELIQRGRKLYRESADKEWPLTDCISFVVMKDQGLAEALTADHHFEQAGFTALLSQAFGSPLRLRPALLLVASRSHPGPDRTKSFFDFQPLTTIKSSDRALILASPAFTLTLTFFITSSPSTTCRQTSFCQDFSLYSV